MDPIKEAFLKIKEDIELLRIEINNIKKNQEIIGSFLDKITVINNKLDKLNQQTNKPTDTPTNPTDTKKNNDLYSLNTQNNDFSMRNGGVPTDKPTNQQTNQQTNNTCNNEQYLNKLNYFEKADLLLNTLDDTKKGLRRMFKNLTSQEMLVFETLYNFDIKKDDDISYKKLANILNLSESSIRDYINKLINKGILIEKHRINNKNIVLSISNRLKEITNLTTIKSLREL